MKEFNVEPGSGEWLSIRLGIPTASQFHKILTPKTRKFSAQARGYAFRLAAEKLLNESGESLDYIEHVQRGKDLEPQAVTMFTLVEDVEVAPVGFLTTDDMMIGATPDRRIVGERAYLEVKCPAPWTHLEYLVDGFGPDYMPQVQGQIFVGEADWAVRWSFHPRMPPRLEKTPRDPTVHDHMANVLMKESKVREAVSQWETSLKEWETSSPADMEPDEIAQVKRNLEAAKVRLAREVPR